MITATTPTADSSQATPSPELLTALFSADAPVHGPEFMQFLAKHSAPAAAGPEVPTEKLEAEKAQPDDLDAQAALTSMQNLPASATIVAGLPANFAAQRAVLEPHAGAQRPSGAEALAAETAVVDLATAPVGVADGAVAALPTDPLLEAGVAAEESAVAAPSAQASMNNLAAETGVTVAALAAPATALAEQLLSPDRVAQSLVDVSVKGAAPVALTSVPAATPSEVSQGVVSSVFVAAANPQLTVAPAINSDAALTLTEPVSTAAAQPALPALGKKTLASDPSTSNQALAVNNALQGLSSDQVVGDEALQAISGQLAGVQAAGDQAVGGQAVGGVVPLAAASSAVVSSPLVASLGDSASVSRAPIEPHLMRLDSGPVQVEVLKMVRQGGGQIVLELTPPDQGTYRIDLRLDLNGRAQLVIEGASDSVRTRLEQGESGLKEQFAQMGLQLQLNFRQSDQGRSLAQDRDVNDSSTASLNNSASPEDLRASRKAVGMEQALVHLYA